jgi:hypothetical protein
VRSEIFGAVRTVSYRSIKPPLTTFTAYDRVRLSTKERAGELAKWTPVVMGVLRGVDFSRELAYGSPTQTHMY